MNFFCESSLQLPFLWIFWCKLDGSKCLVTCQEQIFFFFTGTIFFFFFCRQSFLQIPVGQLSEITLTGLEFLEHWKKSAEEKPKCPIKKPVLSKTLPQMAKKWSNVGWFTQLLSKSPKNCPQPVKAMNLIRWDQNFSLYLLQKSFLEVECSCEIYLFKVLAEEVHSNLWKYWFTCFTGMNF